MKKLNYPFLLLFVALAFFCNQTPRAKNSLVANTANEQKLIISMPTSFNHAAAKADYKHYFNVCIADVIFTGTDATERWNFVYLSLPIT